MIKKKICLLGNEGTGKTSLANRFATDSFSEIYKSTIGVKLFNKLIAVDDKEVNFVLWDIQGGKESYKKNSYYYNGAFAHIILADMSNAESLESIVNYYEESRENYLSSLCYICFSKCDLIAVQDFELIKQNLDKELSLEGSFITSAKEGIGVSEMFEQLAKKALS